MKPGFTILLFLTVLFLSLFPVSCSKEMENAEAPTILLRWNRQGPTDTRTELETGLIWAFSYVGARLNPGALQKAINWKSEQNFIFNAKELGFPTSALEKVNQLILVAKADLEYKETGSMDLGHFLQFLTQSSWHYYALTEAPKNLNDLIQAKKRPGFWQHFDLSQSTISSGQRRIWFNKALAINEILFVSQEGTGRLEDGSFEVRSQEVIDVMPNGQLRFLIYDGAGRLKSAADTLLSIAGKPGKCQWCHEKHLLPLYLESEDLPGSITREAFLEQIRNTQELIDLYRKNLSTDIRFENAQDHQWAELLHLGYEEPSPFRLAQEWNTDTTSLKIKLNNLNTHINGEHPGMEKLYRRKDLKPFAPYVGIPVPESSREPGNFEPDVFRLAP